MSNPNYQLAVDISDQLTVSQASWQDQLMVETQEIREAFTARLNEALDECPGIRKGRGRNVDMHAALRKYGMEATTQATNKWLRAESMPEKDKLRQLAAWLGVRAPWLEYGEGLMTETASAAGAEPPPLDSNVTEGPETRGMLPLISWVQAGSWNEVVDLYAVGDAEQWLPCPASHGARCFALRVRGESMFDPHGRRSFREGDIVYVDPDRPADSGCLVIAKLTDNQEATFKQLVIEGDSRYLKALNPSWPERIIPINGNCQIVGVVFSKVEMF